MHPELFGFIKSYGLMLDLSFVLGIWLCVRRGRGRGLSTDTVLAFSFAVLVSSLVGVRLFYVVTHWRQFTPWYRAFYIWDGGLTLYGGILLATATVWWMARRRKIPFLAMADVMAPAVALGIGITRIGCFLSGCCFGRPTSLPWGVSFPATCAAGALYPGQRIHPTQLYSSAGGFLVFGLLLVLERRSSPTGATFGRFLLFYGLVRFSIEFLRYHDVQAMSALGLSDSQWISLGLMAGGALLLLLLRRRRV